MPYVLLHDVSPHAGSGRIGALSMLWAVQGTGTHSLTISCIDACHRIAAIHERHLEIVVCDGVSSPAYRKMGKSPLSHESLSHTCGSKPWPFKQLTHQRSKCCLYTIGLSVMQRCVDMCALETWRHQIMLQRHDVSARYGCNCNRPSARARSAAVSATFNTLYAWPGARHGPSRRRTAP